MMLPRCLSANLAVLVAVSALCGLSWGWGRAPYGIVLSAAVPLLWNAAGSRGRAFIVMAPYFLVTSRGLPHGTGIFFAESAPSWFGWALWLAAAGGNAAVWAACWARSASARCIGLLAALLLTTIPPVGIFGWANPLTAAGWAFPALGFAGLALLVALWISAIVDHRRVALLCVAIAVVANVGNGFAETKSIPMWVAQDTHFGRLGGDGDDFRAMYERVATTREMADALPAGATLVLPETFLGLLTAGGMSVIDELRAIVAAKGSRLIVGAQVFSRPGSLDTDNVLFVVDAGGTTQMRQRVPVPFGMWHPWAAGSTNAYPFDVGAKRIANHQVAYLICYEQLLVLPVLTSFWHSPDILVGAANDWWARDTSIPTIQAQVMDGWARLFDVPVIRATNL